MQKWTGDKSAEKRPAYLDRWAGLGEGRASVAASAAAVSFAVVAAGVSAVVVVAEGVGVSYQLARGKVLGGLVGGAGDAGKGENVQLREGVDGAGTDAAADHGADAQGPEQTSQSPVTLPTGGEDHGATHLAVGDVIDLKGGRFSEMLEDLTFFIGNCEFHGENLLGCDMGSDLVKISSVE